MFHLSEGKTKIKKIAAVLFCILFTSMALSQQEYEEVVYLKNGSVIKGTIIEQVPDVSIKIQTKDGNIFVYQMEEIDRITKEIIEPSVQTDDVVNGVHQHDGFFQMCDTPRDLRKLQLMWEKGDVPWLSWMKL